MQQFIGDDPTKYFCRKHVVPALERQHLYTADAFAELRDLTTQTPARGATDVGISDSSD